MDSRYLSQPWRFWKVSLPRADIQSPSKTWRVVAKISAIHLWAITYIFQNKMLRCDIEISHRNATMRYLYIVFHVLEDIEKSGNTDDRILKCSVQHCQQIWFWKLVSNLHTISERPSLHLLSFTNLLTCLLSYFD